jgi:pyruvate dehydrogenase E2 component (dihydrolipoamide acetyltransferase)
MALTQLIVPNIGDLHDVTIIEILVKPGDSVTTDQDVVTVESDKAAMQIGATAAGVVKRLLVQLGDKVNAGTALAELDPANHQAESAVALAPVAPACVAPQVETVHANVEPRAREHAPVLEPPVARSSMAASAPHASPGVRRLARELGVPLGSVSGTGTRGRITRDDVQRHIRTAVASLDTTSAQGARGVSLAPWPEVDFASFGPVERQPLSRIQKLSGANLARNWALIPHVTNHDEADITELEEFRRHIDEEQRAHGGAKVTALTFIIKAVAATLKRFPTFNASLAGDELVLKRYYNVGFAVDTPKGLVVPVVRDADQKGLLAIAAEVASLAELGRTGKLTAQQMLGGTFTVSSLGGIGGTGFTPIINAPEVAILGVSRAALRPGWDGQQFRPRLMLPLSLSYDHRVIDGVAAARFNAQLRLLLGDLRRVSL